MKEYNQTLSKVRLVREQTLIPSARITCSGDMNEYVRKFWDSDMSIQETFVIMFLNNNNGVVDYTVLSKGGITGTLVDVRIACKYAIDTLACAVILAHNHPSGTLNASTADKEITKKLKKAMEMFDIRVLDHIILSPYDNGYFSFADEGII